MDWSVLGPTYIYVLHRKNYFHIVDQYCLCGLVQINVCTKPQIKSGDA